MVGYSIKQSTDKGLRQGLGRTASAVSEPFKQGGNYISDTINSYTATDDSGADQVSGDTSDNRLD